MSTSRLIFKVSITPEQPISITLPDGARRFPTMPIGSDENGRFKYTCYIPGTTLRGKMRHLIVSDIGLKSSQSGDPKSLTWFYANMLGQDQKSETASDSIDLNALMVQRQENPILDLFGCGLSLGSRISFGHLVPSQPVAAIVMNGVRKDLDSDEGVLNLLTPQELSDWSNRQASTSQKSEANKLVKAKKTELSKAVKDKKDPQVIESIQAELQVLELQAAEAKGNMGEMKNSTKHLWQYEAFPIGVPLHATWVIERALKRDFELLCNGLSLLSLNPKIGGHIARGAGQISGTLQLFLDDTSQMPIATLRFGDFKALEIEYAPQGEARLKKAGLL